MSVASLPTWFTITEAAEHAKVGKNTIRRAIDRGEIRVRRIGRVVRITDVELSRWMLGDTIDPGPVSGPKSGAAAPGPGELSHQPVQQQGSASLPSATTGPREDLLGGRAGGRFAAGGSAGGPLSLLPPPRSPEAMRSAGGVLFDGRWFEASA